MIIDQILGVTHGSKLQRSITFVLIESGVVLFSIQLTRLVLTISPTNAAYNAFQLISAINQQFNIRLDISDFYFTWPRQGITPTIILVRVSMGLSFHDETSMEEAVGSLCSAHDPLKSNSEMGTRWAVLCK